MMDHLWKEQKRKMIQHVLGVGKRMVSSAPVPLYHLMVSSNGIDSAIIFRGGR